jgi:hypothetical protein
MFQTTNQIWLGTLSSNWLPIGLLWIPQLLLGSGHQYHGPMLPALWARALSLAKEPPQCIPKYIFIDIHFN